MTATATTPRPAAPPSRRGRREGLARLERPLLLAGLALVALHLLDLALAGPDTTVLGVLGIVAVPACWALAQPRLTRPTRLALAVPVGLLAFGFGVVSHGLHVVNNGPDWTDVTGVGMIAGGLLLAASGLLALAARGRSRPWWRVPLWLAAIPVVGLLAVMPFATILMTTHAPRWEIQESSLGIPHEEVAIEAADVSTLAAWYVPSRNRTAVLLSHGSGGSRERVAAHVRMLARHGYGVLALDNPGNGESQGRSNGLGYNVQPALDAALDWLARRPDVDPARIAGFGTSLGAEVLLEAAAGDPRLRAVVADGPARPMDAEAAGDHPLPQRAFSTVWLGIVRGVSGMREAPSLVPLMPRIAPRPVLLIAGGVGAPDEIPANRAYRDAGGRTTQLWELPDTGHTAGLRTHPAEYERRTTAFLDRALGLREAP